MSVTGFHSEWLTLGKHRVLLDCRSSFPNDEMRFIARVAATICDHHAPEARLVHVHFADKVSFYELKIASTDPTDRVLEKTVMEVLHTIFNDGNCQPTVVIVERGNTESDRYNHMAHLSTQAGVAVDRCRGPAGTNNE